MRIGANWSHYERPNMIYVTDDVFLLGYCILDVGTDSLKSKTQAGKHCREGEWCCENLNPTMVVDLKNISFQASGHEFLSLWERQTQPACPFSVIAPEMWMLCLKLKSVSIPDVSISDTLNTSWRRNVLLKSEEPSLSFSHYPVSCHFSSGWLFSRTDS